MDLSDRVAVVTGGSTGIGRAICLRLAQAGAVVVIGYRSDEAGALKTAQSIADLGGPEASVQQLDVADHTDTERAFAAVARRYRRIDILVNNAGVGHPSAVVPMNPVSEWTASIQTNLMGTLHCIKRPRCTC